MDHLVQHLLLSPVMCTSSLLANHFKIKINIPFTCNIIIKVLPGSHTRQRSGLHLLKTAFNLGILQNKIHTQLKEKKKKKQSTIKYIHLQQLQVLFQTLTSQDKSFLLQCVQKPNFIVPHHSIPNCSTIFIKNTNPTTIFKWNKLKQF